MLTAVMGVLNVTPDSFFDGGRYFDPAVAIDRGLAIIDEGADIVDVGGESTRPGAQPVSVSEELRRVLPVIDALAPHVRISIDTMKPEVADAAIDAGATLINDVSCSLEQVASERAVGLCIMHMQGLPGTMQLDPHYDDVVAEVTDSLILGARHASCLGIDEIYLDPGIGFGKTVAHNLSLLGALGALVAAGWPVVVGTSRKSTLGVISSNGATPLPPQERFEASLATAVWAMACGAAIVRVHDVKATVDAAKIVGDVSSRCAQLTGAIER